MLLTFTDKSGSAYNSSEKDGGSLKLELTKFTEEAIQGIFFGVLVSPNGDKVKIEDGKFNFNNIKIKSDGD